MWDSDPKRRFGFMAVPRQSFELCSGSFICVFCLVHSFYIAGLLSSHEVWNLRLSGFVSSSLVCLLLRFMAYGFLFGAVRLRAFIL